MQISNLKENANVFVKNIDPVLSSRDLATIFSDAGDVIVVDLRTNDNGESLGYGCV